MPILAETIRVPTSPLQRLDACDARELDVNLAAVVVCQELHVAGRPLLQELEHPLRRLLCVGRLFDRARGGEAVEDILVSEDGLEHLLRTFGVEDRA